MDLEKIYFIVSYRTRDGYISYDIADNLRPLPRGARKVFGTGHYFRGVVESRLEKCQDGSWFNEQREERRLRDQEDERMRKELHAEYLRNEQRVLR